MNAASAAILAIFCAGPGWAARPADMLPPLANVKKVYVEQLGGGQTSDQMRDMIIAALQGAGLFTITENQQNADALLRGSADDRIYTEDHNSSESLGLHANSGIGSSSSNSTSGGASSHQSAGAGISDNESSHIQERRHEATASIRLVAADGDVIWSSTQESAGGKFRGAMADVADKLTRQLAGDMRKARSGTALDKTTPDKSPEMRQ